MDHVPSECFATELFSSLWNEAWLHSRAPAHGVMGHHAGYIEVFLILASASQLM